MSQVTHIGVLFAAQLHAILMAGVGLVAGVLYSTLGLVYDIRVDQVGGGTALAFLAPVGMPLVFAVAGFLAGAVGALVFNVVARWVGGVPLEMDFR